MKGRQEKIIRFYFSNIGETLRVYANTDTIFGSLSTDADDFRLRSVFFTINQNEVIRFNSGPFFKKNT